MTVENDSYNQLTQQAESSLLDKLVPADDDSPSCQAVRAMVQRCARATAEAHVAASVSGAPQINLRGIDERYYENVTQFFESAGLSAAGIGYAASGGELVNIEQLARELVEVEKEAAKQAVIDGLEQQIADKEQELASLREGYDSLVSGGQYSPQVVESSQASLKTVHELAMTPVFDDEPHTVSGEIKTITAQLRHVGGHILQVVGIR